MSGPSEDVKAEGNADRLTLKNPVDLSTLNITEQIKGYRLVRDGEGNVWAQVVILIDPTVNPVSARPSISIEDVNQQTVAVQQVAGDSSITTLGLVTRANIEIFNNVSGQMESQRTPTTFKVGTASAIGSTALWTPAGGKKFRVLGYSFALPSTATSAAGTTITLMDSATAKFQLVAIGLTSGTLFGAVMLPGNGYLSSAVDNVLNINLSAALTAGVISVNVYGTEE